MLLMWIETKLIENWPKTDLQAWLSKGSASGPHKLYLLLQETGSLIDLVRSQLVKVTKRQEREAGLEIKKNSFKST
jgi:hypothetical protein